jgi:hypothetical protein
MLRHLRRDKTALLHFPALDRATLGDKQIELLPVVAKIGGQGKARSGSGAMEGLERPKPYRKPLRAGIGPKERLAFWRRQVKVRAEVNRLGPANGITGFIAQTVCSGSRNVVPRPFCPLVSASATTTQFFEL